MTTTSKERRKARHDKLVAKQRESAKRRKLQEKKRRGKIEIRSAGQHKRTQAREADRAVREELRKARKQDPLEMMRKMLGQRSGKMKINFQGKDDGIRGDLQLEVFDEVGDVPEQLWDQVTEETTDAADND